MKTFILKMLLPGDILAGYAGQMNMLTSKEGARIFENASIRTQTNILKPTLMGAWGNIPKGGTKALKDDPRWKGYSLNDIKIVAEEAVPVLE